MTTTTHDEPDHFPSRDWRAHVARLRAVPLHDLATFPREGGNDLREGGATYVGSCTCGETVEAPSLGAACHALADHIEAGNTESGTDPVPEVGSGGWIFSPLSAATATVGTELVLRGTGSDRPRMVVDTIPAHVVEVVDEQGDSWERGGERSNLWTCLGSSAVPRNGVRLLQTYGPVIVRRVTYGTVEPAETETGGADADAAAPPGPCDCIGDH